jgi:phenylalanyl-tRNA synthetase beta chain
MQPSAQDLVKAAKGVDRQLIDASTCSTSMKARAFPRQKSLAIAITLQPKERTLTDAEIDAIAQKS